MFPHVAVEMVEVGESTGALADMLNSVADFYDEENETSLTRFSNLIQPVLLDRDGRRHRGAVAVALHAAVPAVDR